MDLVKYGKILGYLEVFQKLNSYGDHTCCYSFKYINNTGSVISSLKKYFEPNTNYSLALESLEDWKSVLMETLESWFYSDCESGDKSGWQCSGSMRHCCLNDFMGMIIDFFGEKDIKVWRVHISSNNENEIDPPYGTYWDDFVFGFEDKLFLLHLGVFEHKM
ncbi:MAG: hypothetical protein N2645_07235 [Clostridia bacterium]|nr:hypothetical protein [Clostridia bacterium]